MRVYENDNPLPRINIRSRFDFDSDKPVQGTVVDEEKAKSVTWFYEKAVHNLSAINVILGGWWLMDWWYHGGYHFMRVVFQKGASWLLLLSDHGLFTG